MRNFCMFYNDNSVQQFSPHIFQTDREKKPGKWCGPKERVKKRSQA